MIEKNYIISEPVSFAVPSSILERLLFNFLEALAAGVYDLASSQRYLYFKNFKNWKMSWLKVIKLQR